MNMPPSSAPQSEPYRPTIGMQGKPKRSLRLKLLIAAVAVAGVLAGLFGYGLLTGISVESQASEHCQELVTDALTSPASAEFSDVETNLAGTLYTTTGNIDSQNKFGAMIRSTFRCESRQQAEGKVVTKVIELESK